MASWFWNIDRSYANYFIQELNAGRLRQGWGYLDELDLNKILHKKNAGMALNTDEIGTWDHCDKMITAIRAGDYIVVKNIPTNNHFTIVVVIDGYGFDLDKSVGDYGHYLKVDRIGEYHKNAEVVPSELVSALNRERNSIRITYKHDNSVVGLLKFKGDPRATMPEAFKEKVYRWKKSLEKNLWDEMSKDLNATLFEQLIKELLRRDGFENVRWTAGAGEKGADIIAERAIDYGLVVKIAIQVKYHKGVTSDRTGVDQIVQAFEAHEADVGLLVTSADELSDDLKEYISSRQKECRRKIEVLYGEYLNSRLLEAVVDHAHQVE